MYVNTNINDMESIINKISIDPYSVSKKISNQQLAKVIEYANDKYYNSDDEIITDEIYDILREQLIKRDPKNPILKKVGAPIPVNKVKLPFWMGSMDKIKPDTNVLSRWIQKYKKPYNISDKLDGTSGMFHFFKKDRKWKTRLYTRGNGTYGQDISHLIPYLFPNIKQNLPDEQELCVRGEIIMSKKNFKKYDMKNSRSLTNGIVNSKKNINVSIIKDVDFVVFDLVEPRTKKSKALKYVKSLGFKTVWNININSLTNDNLSDFLIKRRKESPYEIDGIIVEEDKKHKRITSGNPKYGFAFKMVLSDQIVESKILDVIWQASKHGALKPRILIESVIIGGITINYLTGHNAKYIKDNVLGPGAIIKLTLGGGIIPHILETIKPAKQPKLPHDIDYHWNKTNIDIVLDKINSNDEVIIRRITHFFNKIETKFLSKGLITRMIKNGFQNINDFINATQDDFLQFEGIKEKLATKLYNSIQLSIKDVPLEKLMDASNIFGYGFGERKFKAIIKIIPNILTIQKNEQELIEMVENIKGFKTTASQFAVNLPAFKMFMTKYPKITIKNITNNKRKREASDSESNHLDDLNVLFTGIRDKELEKYILEHGGEISNSFTNSVNIVITGDLQSKSGKIKKAKKKNIPIVLIDNFKNTYIN